MKKNNDLKIINLTLKKLEKFLTLEKNSRQRRSTRVRLRTSSLWSTQMAPSGPTTGSSSAVRSLTLHLIYIKPSPLSFRRTVVLISSVNSQWISLKLSAINVHVKWLGFCDFHNPRSSTRWAMPSASPSGLSHPTSRCFKDDIDTAANQPSLSYPTLSMTRSQGLLQIQQELHLSSQS